MPVSTSASRVRALVLLATAACVAAQHECSFANRRICANKGQHCADPDLAVTGDWVCECIAPDSGAPGQQSPSTDCTLPDECKTKADVCMNMGQHCIKGLNAGEFQCECIAPETGPPVAGGPAVCETDECVAVCATCQKTTPAAQPVCETQQCVDPDKTTTSNWECRCAPPATGTAAVMKLGACRLDECVVTCTTCAGTTCWGTGQSCSDPDTTTPKNWYCSCPPPAIGYPKMGVATCIMPVGECLAGQPGATACPAGQVCVDPNAAVMGDWQCQCLTPATGAAGLQAPAAACTLDECTIPPACAGAGAQQCTDPNQVMAGDWQCACVAPQVGYPKLAARAGCFTTNTGECAAGQAGITGCPSTALQVCVDPNAANANDWTCQCKPPATGTPGNQAAATCTLNECEVLANAAICPSAANQACEDLNTGLLDDWTCKCAAPWTGASVTKAVATCTLDECTVAVNAAVCAAATQTCNDPNTAVVQDWACTCQAPATGTPAVKAAATCVLNECLTAANVIVCTAAGQTCVDPNKSPANKEDWTCACTAPATGAPVVKAAATCVLNECLTAANVIVCTAAGQTCVDPNKSPANKEDWTCTCTAPATGTPAVKAAATCTTAVDECVANAATCPAGTQTCNDPNTSVIGDWLCKCTAPSIGQNVAAAATCASADALCNTHTCTSGSQLKASASSITCTGTPPACIDATCCDKMCSTHTCSETFLDKPSKATLPCGATPPVCDDATCCDAEFVCAGHTCGTGFVGNAGKSNTSCGARPCADETCCLAAVPVSTFVPADEQTTARLVGGTTSGGIAVVSAVGGVTGASGLSKGGARVARNMVYLSMMDCPRSGVEEVGFVLSPTRLSFGGGDLREVRGAVVGNLALLALVVALLVGVAALQGGRFLTSLAGMPLALPVFLLELLWMPVVQGGFAFVMYSESEAAGGAAVLACAFLFLVGTGLLTRKAKAQCTFVRNKRKKGLVWLVTAGGTWESTDGLSRPSVDVLASVFDGFYPAHCLYFVVQLVLMTGLAGLAAWNPETIAYCRMRAGMLTVLPVGWAAVLLKDLPYLRPIENAVEILITLCEFVFGVLAAMAVGDQDQGLYDAAAVLGVVMTYIMMVKTAVDLCTLVYQLREEYTNHGTVCGPAVRMCCANGCPKCASLGGLKVCFSEPMLASCEAQDVLGANESETSLMYLQAAAPSAQCCACEGDGKIYFL